MTPVLLLLTLGLLPATALGSNLIASHFSGTIYSLALNDETGELSITHELKAGGKTPSWLTLDSATGDLYSNDENQVGTPLLSALSIQSDGSLKVTGTAQTPGGEVHSTLYGGSDGRSFIAAAEYDPSSIVTYALPLSNSTKQLQNLTFTMDGPGPVPERQEKPHPHSVFTDPTGQFLLSADLGSDQIRIFGISSPTGRLSPCPAAAAGGGDGPRHGAFYVPNAPYPEGATLYVANELANTVTAWNVTFPARSSGCLALEETQSLSTFPPGFAAPPGAKAAEVRVAGRFVYVTNRWDRMFGEAEDSVATYAVGDDGSLSYVENTSTHSSFPRTFEINKAGTLVAFGGQTSSNVAIVKRDPESGRLGELVASIDVGTPGTVNMEDGLSAVVWDE